MIVTAPSSTSTTPGPDVEVGVEWVNPTLAAEWLGSPSTLAFCRFVCDRDNADRVDGFFDPLVSGAKLDTGDPALALRNRLLNARMNRQKLGYEIVGLTLKAWEQYLGSQEVRSLRWSTSEGWPPVLDRIRDSVFPDRKDLHP
jgi:hypothetical protein